MPQAKPAGPGGSCPHDYTSSGSSGRVERSPLERKGGYLFTAQSSPREGLDLVLDILSEPKFSAYINQAKKIFGPGKASQRAGNLGFMPRQALPNALNHPVDFAK